MLCIHNAIELHAYLINLYFDVNLLIMATRHELSLEEKVNLIKEKENGLSHRVLSDKFNVSIGAVSNILKRKLEYASDYQLQSKLTDIFLDSNSSKQRSILEYFSYESDLRT